MEPTNPGPTEKTIDILAYAVKDTADIPINSADGFQIPGASITLYSPASATHRAAKNKWISRNKIIPSGDEAAFFASNVEYYADCTVKFNGFEYQGLTGRALFEGVYGNPHLGFISDQVFAALRSWEKFSSPVGPS